MRVLILVNVRIMGHSSQKRKLLYSRPAAATNTPLSSNQAQQDVPSQPAEHTGPAGLHDTQAFKAVKNEYALYPSLYENTTVSNSRPEHQKRWIIRLRGLLVANSKRGPVKGLFLGLLRGKNRRRTIEA